VENLGIFTKFFGHFVEIFSGANDPSILKAFENNRD